MHEPADLERPLTALETTLWLLDRLARLSFVMVAPVAGPLTEETLRLALDAVQARHPLLRVRVILEADRLSYRCAGVPAIPLRTLQAPLEGWQDETEWEQQASFPTETGPLVRCALLQHAPGSATVLLAFHHMIGDGLSGGFLVRDVLQAAGEAFAGRVPRLEPLPPAVSLDESLPATARGWVAAWNHLKMMTRDQLPYLFRGFPRRLPLDADVPVQERRTCIVPRALDLDTTRALVERARREETTVHGALAAAQLRAIAAEVGPSRSVPLALGSAVSLRSQLPPPAADAVGFFVSLVTATHRVASGSALWPLAREVRGEVARRLERGEPWTSLAAARWGMTTFRRWIPLNEVGALKLANSAESFGHGASGLTNLGVLTIPERYGPLSLEALHFAGAMSALCNLGSSAVTFAGRLRWNFIFQAPSVSRSRAERIADRALDGLREAVAV